MSGDSRQSDAELLRAVRAGGTMAYGALYERHVAAARALAAQLVHDEAEVEDVVAETFGAVLDQVRRGGGPEAAFRPYLLSAVRRTCHERTGAWPSEPGERGEPSASGEPGEPGGPSEPDELGELVERGEPVADAGPARLERAPIARAFLSLPERWRLVLWHTEVENARPAAVAPLLGMSAGGAAALASRAREGLRQAYLHMHLAGASRQECRPVAAKLGAYARGGLGRRESRLVDEHIADCTDCRAVYHELNDLGQGLRVVVGPLYTGPVLAGYLAALARAEGGRAVPVLGRIDRTPKPWLVAFAVSAPVAAAVVAGAYFLVSAEGPVRPFARPPAITPTPTIMPAPERQEPPRPGRPRRGGPSRPRCPRRRPRPSAARRPVLASWPASTRSARWSGPSPASSPSGCATRAAGPAAS
ncbi:zf-HC2 domain-containing protein [Thermocatellispora tengchongensis]|uniref:zf-HC2 domain-containing protein n=1 Tax=Thermocatellispora tengchongensis TaxID=1073253 RepID=UPI003635EBA5